MLAVMWLAAALSAIAFSVATSVRGEIERAATLADGVRAHYLAAGAVDRALLRMIRESAPPVLDFSFPSGEARVEIIPETARLSLNYASAEDLVRLMVAAGAPPDRAQRIAEAIVDWRTPAAGGFSPFDRHYLSLVPSFRARHASFEEVEELLLVKDMTPELFHGGYAADARGRLVPFGGLKELVSVFGTTGPFDVNSAPAPLLASIGLPPEVAARLVETRRAQPFHSPEQLDSLRAFAGAAVSRLRIGGNSIYTVRATARLRLAGGQPGDLLRTVSATVKLRQFTHGLPYQVLRWRESPEATAW